DSDQVRNLQRQTTEQSLQIQNLASELDEVRSRKELAAVEHEQRERLLNRRLVEETANAKTVRVERDALQIKVNSLQEETRMLKKMHETAAEEASCAKKELLKVKSALEESKHHASIELNDTKVKQLKVIKSFEIQISDMKTQIMDLEM
ncbi:hypothetical protein HK100_007000, partial [Physocladia obscura]